eukprot:g4555.t1
MPSVSTVKKGNDKHFVPKKHESTGAPAGELFNEKKYSQISQKLRFCSKFGCCKLVRPGYGPTCPPGDCHHKEFSCLVNEYHMDGSNVKGKKSQNARAIHKVAKTVKGLWVPSKAALSREEACKLLMLLVPAYAKLMNEDWEGKGKKKTRELYREKTDRELVEEVNKIIIEDALSKHRKLRKLAFLEKVEGLVTDRK